MDLLEDDGLTALCVCRTSHICPKEPLPTARSLVYEPSVPTAVEVLPLLLPPPPPLLEEEEVEELPFWRQRWHC